MCRGLWRLELNELLPVHSAGRERAFSKLSLIKSELRSTMRDE